MTLHEIEWAAGELIAVTGAVIGWAWVREQSRKHQPPPDSPGRGETTEYSSTQDD